MKILHGEKMVSGAPGSDRCLAKKKKVIALIKPVVSYKAGKGCKVLTKFFAAEEEEEELKE